MDNNINIINIKIKTLFSKHNLILLGFLYIKDKDSSINREKLKLRINVKEYNIKFIFKRIINVPLINIVSNLYIIKIPIDELLTKNIHNKPFFIYKHDNGEENKWSLRYSIFNNKTKYLNSKIKIIEDRNTSIYVRQSNKNRLIITVREIDKTDYLKEQLKINIACFIAKFICKSKIIMYEKHSERYEESSSILYEKLIDEGYKKIYYIINRENEILNKLENKYKQNMIYKYSFKHYLAYFSAKALIGTESPGHAIELRVANKHAAYRVYKGKFKYVFLQHGVMYMISLDSKGRSFFRKDGSMPKNCKVVVSSKEEANHFITLAGFKKEDLYITGLPKYDKSKLNDNADRITIMPTWRPWEYNKIRNDIYNSPYYRFIEEIIASVPDKLKNRIVLMPHPLFLESLQQSELSKYINIEFTHNEILENTKVLITDYSSISYDAFYRGCNVIFYWKEKDCCMEQYGGHLMLNQENAFGEICYNKEKLSEIMEKVYNDEQKNEHIVRYKKIVEFHDNNNTNRLIQFLEKDNIIRKEL